MSIHLSLNCVRFFGKDVLEISELNSNQIIGNLYNSRLISNFFLRINIVLMNK